MRTRCKCYPFNSTATIPRRSNRRRIPNIVEPEIRTIEEVVPMADRTIEELLQAPTEGYGEAIIISEILAENFKIKTNLPQLVQSNKFHGRENENPHTHISNFKRMTATLKYRDVPNDAIKLMLFPYSLEDAARIWYEKEPPNSILTWDDLVNKFINQFFPQFFPPSKTTHLKNEISRFTQRFEETFGEAWDRFKEMLRACPHHGFSELTQIDTFYNGLNEQNQDSLNAAAGVIAPASAKVVEKTYVTCGGAHAYYDCIASDSNQPSVCAATGSYNQINVLRGDFNKQEENLRINLNNDMQSILGGLFQNQALTPGTLPSNSVPNPKGEMKVVTTRSGLAYEGPSIPANSPIEKADEQNTEEIMNKEHSNCPGSTAQVQPPVLPISIPGPDIPRTQPKPTIPYPFTDALLLMPKFASTIKSLLTNKDKLFELAKVPLNENCSAMLLKKLPENLGDPGKFLIPCDFLGMDVCHALSDLGASINLMPWSIWKKLSLPELTPTQMTLELADRSITHPKGVAEDVFVKVRKFYFPTDFVVVDFEADPRVPLILGRSFLRIGRALIDVYGKEITLRYNPKSSNPTLVSDPSIPESDFSKNPIVKSSSPILTPFGEKPPELELKELPSHLEYAFLEDSNKLPVIIAKDLKDVEKEALINVLKSHKRVIAWKISDIKGIDSRFCTYKILMEDDYKPAVQSQRRMNPKIHDVIKKEVIKLLDAGMIYPISDSPWVSPIHCVPKKGGMTVVANENNELIPTRLVTGWRNLRVPSHALGLCNAPGTFRREGIVLGHKISKSRIEVLKAKVDVISKLPHPTTIKGVRSFLGHASFYRRFIQDFLKIARPMTHLLEKETPFVFSKECVDAFNTLNKKLTEAPILVVPDWNLPFELMCDASDFAIGAPYLVLSKSIVYTDHSALKYSLNKQDAKPRLLRWVLLLQEFDIIILDKKESENLAADHLSRLENPHKDVLENKDINENILLENLGSLSCDNTSWFADIANFHARNFIKKGLTSQQKKKFFKDLLISSKLAMRDLLGAIMVPISQRRRGKEKSLIEMKCLKTLSKFVRYSMYGGKPCLMVYKLDDALWAFRIAFKTPIGCTPYKLVYGKSCHLPIELEHRAYWALKHVSFDLKTAGDHRKLQLNELNELRDQAYENYVIYKERINKLHDSKIKNRIFNVGDQVLLFNSCLKIFSGKLKTRWSGPFTITQVFSYGTIELSQPNGPNFKVNGHRVKHYFGGDIPSNVVPDLHTFLMEK
nr:hypothetical protein [Tanacetum cinerariifolium]